MYNDIRLSHLTSDWKTTGYLTKHTIASIYFSISLSSMAVYFDTKIAKEIFQRLFLQLYIQYRVYALKTDDS